MSDTSRGGQQATSPTVCGHRGMPVVAPQNTLESFLAAQANGAAWIEFDVRPCDGGELVVHHDPVTADAKHIASTSFDALGAHIPTLRQVLETIGDSLGLDIELKTNDIGIDLDEFVARTLQVIDDCVETVDPARLVVTSFDVEALAIVRSTNMAVPTGLLFRQTSMDWAIETATAAGHSVVAPWYPLVNEEGVRRAHDAGLDVVTWTVNTTEQIQRVAAAGVDMIVGDDVALIAEVLALQ